MTDEEFAPDPQREDQETGIVPIAPKLPTIRKQKEKLFTDAVIVRRLGGDDISVPMTPEGIRNANVITAEAARDLVEKTIRERMLSDDVMAAKELKELVEVAKGAIELATNAQLNVIGETGETGLSASVGPPDPKNIKTASDFLALMSKMASHAKESTKNVTHAKP